MNQMSAKRRAQVVAALCEGNSVRSTVRMTGAAKGTVLKLFADLGAACRDYLDATMVDLPCERLQCDEIWSFCYAKDRNVPPSMLRNKVLGCSSPNLVGSVWTWVAIDADKRDWSNDRFANHPWKWVVGCVFLWIVAFPAYLIRRGNAPLTP